MTQPPVPPEQPPEQPGEFSDFFRTDELPTGPVERHSHRGSPANGPLGRRVLAPLTAVAVVVVVILLLIWINGKPAGNGPGPGVISAPTGRTTARGTVPPSTRPDPHHPHSAVPVTTSTPTSPVSTTSTAAPSGGSPAVSAANRSAMAPVDVLNNSTISGLAARVATEVKAKGWTVPTVGNLQGAIPVTTVFYPAGDLAAAKHLRREFASIARVAPNASAHLATKHLTLVVTRNWSG